MRVDLGRCRWSPLGEISKMDDGLFVLKRRAGARFVCPGGVDVVCSIGTWWWSRSKLR